MFPQRAAWRTRSSAASSANATRSRSFTRARGCGGRPTTSPDDVAAFNEAFGRVAARVDGDPRRLPDQHGEPGRRDPPQVPRSLIHALRLGDAIGADGVVLHAGSRKGDPVDEAMARSGELVREALAESERCRVLYENTAGTQGPLGRDFDELASLVESAGAGERIGVCLDCCHLFASGYDIVADEDLGRRDRRVRRERSARPAAVPARQRQSRAARGQPRHARQRRRGRDGGRGHRELPLRAPLREPARPARDARARQEGRRLAPRSGVPASCEPPASRPVDQAARRGANYVAEIELTVRSRRSRRTRG